jgi:hypothetical protein
MNSSAEDAPRQTLDLLQPGDSTVRPYNVLVGRNLGNMTVTLALPMYQFYGMSAVSNEAGLAEREVEGSFEISQRKLDSNHAKKLALYLLRALVESTKRELERSRKSIPQPLLDIQEQLGRQPYFATQPIVANLRNSLPGGAGLPVEAISPGFARIFLSDADVLWVIDGQHRRFAMDFLFEFLHSVITTHKYSKRNSLYCPSTHSDATVEELVTWHEIYKTARQGCNVIVDVHLGLTAEQEKQVFHDLNNLSKPVATSLAYQFDNSNAVNLFIKEQLLDESIISCKVSDRDVTNWHDDDGGIAYKDLVAINARLFLNKTTIAGAAPRDVTTRQQVATRFWQAISKIPHWGDSGARLKTVAAQPVVLKALAKLSYDFAFGRDANVSNLNRLLDSIPDLNWTHENPCWRYYAVESGDREELAPGLGSYLPPVGDGANRDIGGWEPDDYLFRFGAKHNDILPIVGDMIRWMAELPNRHRNVEGG